MSSIEVLILDQADVFLMQNWEHLLVSLSTHISPLIFKIVNSNLEKQYICVNVRGYCLYINVVLFCIIVIV